MLQKSFTGIQYASTLDIRNLLNNKFLIGNVSSSALNESNCDHEFQKIVDLL